MQEHLITNVKRVQMRGVEFQNFCSLRIIITNEDGHKITIKLFNDDNVRLIKSFNGKRVNWRKDLAA